MKLNKATIEDLKKFLPYFEKKNEPYEHYSCGIWGMYFNDMNVMYCIEDDCLVLANNFYKNKIYFLHPISLKNDRAKEIELIKESALYAQKNEKQLVFADLSVDLIPDIIDNCGCSWDILHNRKYDEYIYDAKLFAAASGPNLAKMRNGIKRFIKDNPNYEVSIINESNLSEVKEFIINWWNINKNKEIGKYGVNEANNEPLFIDLFNQFHWLGIIVRINGKIIGVSLGEIIGNNLFCHVEKVDHNFKGANEFVANIFAKTFVTDDIKYLSRLSDDGIPGLRKAKLQLYPLALYKSYNAFPHTTIHKLNKIVPTVKTERLVLKDINSNEDKYFELCSDLELNKLYGYDYREDFYLENNKDTQPDLNYFITKRKQWFNNESEVTWGIYENEYFHGEVVLHNFGYDNTCELGVRLFKTSQHQGYAYEACKTIAEYALYELGNEKVYCKAYKENLASQKMILKLNFRKIKEDNQFFYYVFDGK